MTRQPLIVMAAGGTGGHMFPAQALAEEMLARGWRVKLSTDPRGARYTGGFPDAVTVEITDSGTFARGGLMAKLGVPFKILSGAMAAKSSMKADRPDAVIGFGGYPAIPAMLASGWLKLPRLIHEQNGVLGRVNKRFAAKVNAVACGVWPTELPSGAQGHYTGNPVRGSILERAGANYISPGDWPMSLLVIGGSQGARTLSQIVPQAVALLSPKMRGQLRVAQQARTEDIDATQAAYIGAGVEAEIQAFFDDVPMRLAEAQLVISRAGASSVADIAAIGRPSILIPLPTAMDDHQTANARGLSGADAAILLPESELTPDALAECIRKILRKPTGAEQMAHAALSQGKPHAAKELADLVESTAHIER